MSLFPTHETDRSRHLASARFALVAVHRGIERAGGRAGGGTRVQEHLSRDTRGGVGLDAALLYRLPAALADQARLGQLATVPLGRAGKPVTGVIVELGGPELLGDLPAHKVKDLLDLSPAVLPPALLDLAKWIAAYYVCPLGMVLLAMMPAAVKKQIGRTSVTLLTRAAGAHPGDAPAATLDALPKRLRAAWDAVAALDAAEWPLTPKALSAAVEGLSTAGVKKLVAAGLLEAREETRLAVGPDPLLDEAAAAGAAPRHALNDEQQRVVSAISSAPPGFKVHLLQGVTGSGKTEVYLRLIEHLLQQDPTASALLLVPEIALTPQTARRFLDRFGSGSVAVLHSALTASQRHAQWTAAVRGGEGGEGGVRVVVGARSAVFAPLPNLRLIVVDEEHDGSYKQDQLPRYHARDVAVKRGQLEGCPVVLGSATPSIESYDNAATGKFALHRLTQRAAGSTLPTVQIVDLLDERRRRYQQQAERRRQVKAGADSPGESGQVSRDRTLHLVGPTLEQALGETLDAGGQALLLLNRRGFASYLCCPSPACGYVMRCEHCDATVVYHRGENFARGGTPGFVRCHHCLKEVILPPVCPQCKTHRLNTFGLGTQRVEEELARTFAPRGLVIGETLLRVDSDTMHSPREYFRTLDRFAQGEARVLLGTQMIAKGLDFPGVHLVGVISADTALSLPDFRAAERTFQLVCQVAGRAGRGKTPGRVIVQTANPTAPAIVLAARHDYERFAREELALRRRSGLPPATRMARIVCRDTNYDKANRAAQELTHALKAAIAARAPRDGQREDTYIVLRGPMPCPISRIDDHYRLAIELTAPQRGVIQGILGEVRAQGLLISDAHTAVDVDPIALL